MKKRRLYIVLAVVAVLALTAVAFSAFATEEDGEKMALAEELKDVITREYGIIYAADSFPLTEEQHTPAALTAQQRESLKAEYNDSLLTVYKTSCPEFKRYNDARARIIDSSSDKTSSVLENGIFSFKTNSLTFTDTTAEYDVTVESYQKYLTSKGEDYAVSCPTATSKIRYSFEKVDGRWLIASRDEYSYEFGADSSKAASFGTLTEAVKYADGVKVDNVR